MTNLDIFLFLDWQEVIDIRDIENELDSVLDRYQKKQEDTRNKEMKEQEDYLGLENEFKNLFNTIVKPLMAQMVIYLETKGNEFKGSYVKVSPHLAKIALILNPYRLQQGSKWAEIEFSRDGNKLKIVVKNENAVTNEALFEKSEVRPPFVKRILIDFVKSYYNTEGTWFETQFNRDLIAFIYSILEGIQRNILVKKKKVSEKRVKKSNSKKNPVNSDRILRKDFPKITDRELKKLKTDESYKQGFLLAIRLVASELKTIVDKKWIKLTRYWNKFDQIKKDPHEFSD